MTDLLLEGKKAIVTGGRRGIGKTIALALAKAGADVALADIVVDDGELERAANEIRSLGRRSLFVRVDTSRKVEVDNMVRTVADEFGAVNVLVNNAGMNVRGPLLELSEEDWDRVVDVDLKGYYLCAQAVGRKMMEQRGGSIISIASQFAFRAVQEYGVYCVAKAGVVMLSRVLARELGAYGIRANSIAPGIVRTELTRLSLSDRARTERRVAGIPLGRVAETSDLVGAALFLASDSSAYVSGNTILVDGGELA